ncbi:MAG TPA: biopolymer transporter ExbD [Gemmatimonadales bacterium]|nr:biopolymer transporter ExbD [Gemmatimonadales bacterium]
MPMSPRQPTTHQTELNVTPLIDVLLVRLVIFVLVNLLRTRLVQDTRLPPPTSARIDGVPHPIVLELLPAGGYAINRQPVPEAELADHLRRVFAERPVKLLFIQAAPDRRYQELTDAMDLARASGVETIGIVPGSTTPSRER